jgi:CheY-like chemotaxis protein
MSQRTVLVVDDSKTCRALATWILEAEGFVVLTASDGIEGVDIFRHDTDGIDVVLLGMNMPNMNGDEAFRKIRSIQSDVPVVLSSAEVKEDTVSRNSDEGLAGFVPKPYKSSDLIHAVVEAI